MKPTVASVMTPDPVSVRLHTPFKDIVGLLAEHRISAVPVVNAYGSPVGVVSEADLVAKHNYHPEESLPRWWAGRALRRRWRKAHGELAREVMNSPVRTIGADAPLSDAADELARVNVRRLFVTADGILVGVLSRRDLLRVFRRPDDEILRDVEAEVLARPQWGERTALRALVANGVVTLFGTVETVTEGLHAAELTAQVTGVVGVRNRLDPELDDSHLGKPRTFELGR